MGSLLSCLHQP